jgi:hypothetical protein
MENCSLEISVFKLFKSLIFSAILSFTNFLLGGSTADEWMNLTDYLLDSRTSIRKQTLHNFLEQDQSSHPGSLLTTQVQGLVEH